MDRSAASGKNCLGGDAQFFHGNAVATTHLLPYPFIKTAPFHFGRSAEIHSPFLLYQSSQFRRQIFIFHNGIFQRFPRLLLNADKIASTDQKQWPQNYSQKNCFCFFILPPQMSRCCSSDAQFLNTANSNLHLFYCMRDKKDLLQEFLKFHIIDIDYVLLFMVWAATIMKQKGKSYDSFYFMRDRSGWIPNSFHSHPSGRVDHWKIQSYGERNQFSSDCQAVFGSSCGWQVWSWRLSEKKMCQLMCRFSTSEIIEASSMCRLLIPDVQSVPAT